jgi:hypothetical protein
LQPGEQHTKERHKFCVDKIWSMGMNGYSIINLFVMAKAAVQTTQYQTMGVPNLHSFITKPNSCVLLVNRSTLWNEGLCCSPQFLTASCSTLCGAFSAEKVH